MRVDGYFLSNMVRLFTSKEIKAAWNVEREKWEVEIHVREKKAFALYHAGLTLRAVGKLVGRSHEWVNQAVKKQQTIIDKTAYEKQLHCPTVESSESTSNGGDRSAEK